MPIAEGLKEGEMIDRLDKKDIGRWVIYGDGFKKEKGKIKSWNAKWVFVVYKCDCEWDNFQNYTGCATDPNDLNFITWEEVIENSTIREAHKLQHLKS